ncbi:MAG: threonine/serine dehydratase [Nitrososphaerota archaeon]|nr:threonine/serine dehydratase [Nitrososphaerota archaeon]
MREPPDLGDIVEARKRVEGVASRTPLVESPALSKRFGRKVFLKLECFQPIRVFKIRGAYNKVSQVRSDYVVAASSGNHGMAVAYSARILKKRCTVVVPETAVQEKVSAIAEYGAEVVKFGRSSAEREARAREIAGANGAEFVHPYDDPDVIAGQGTCGLEIVEQLADLDSVIVPVGGGGLISGTAIAVKSSKKQVGVFGVEPQGGAKLAAALKAGRRVTIDSHSIADGLIPSSVGELAFEVCKRLVDGVYSVSEEQIVEATRMMLHEAHYVVEPSGAAPVAALMAGKNLERLGERVVLIVSGGNVSLDLLRKIISR